MKRFLLFTGSIYYPSGGMRDFVKDADTIEECVSLLKEFILRDYNEYCTNSREYFIKSELETGWFHVYDTEEQAIVLSALE